MSARILIVDDEPQIRRALGTGLRANNYDVETASDGDEALMLAASDPPDILILDLAMPGTDGIDVILHLREWSQMPIIVLSAHAAERDKVQALDAGADDYLTKPFGMDELLARVRAALRRTSSGHDQPIIEIGGLRLDLNSCMVMMQDQELHLTPTEYELLRELATNAGKVITHQMLLQRVWGPASEDATNYLRVYINQLRRKIEPQPGRPQYILTEPGVGYRFRLPDQELGDARRS